MSLFSRNQSMSASQWALTILLLLLFRDVFATPIVHSATPFLDKVVARRSPGRIRYDTIPAVALADFEYREDVGRIAPLVLHGLGDIVPTRTREYGLRNKESFYWGRCKAFLASSNLHVCS